MTVTPSTLFRASGVAAAVAGLIFIGVQIGSPHLDVTNIASTNAVVRDSLKVLMAALALAGITGMYLLQVKRIGVLGLVGYLTFAVGYLTMLGIEFVAAFVLPSIAHSSPAYVSNAIAEATNGTVTGSIGLIKVAILVNGIAYVAGGFLFGITLFRAKVLARWAGILLACGSVATVATGLMPQYERLFAFPTAVALIALGYSMWQAQRTPAARPVTSAVSSQLEASAAN
ncbi:MAG TPA: hypothetical protein VI434_10090 [Candidatus Dormibacteraeota bacterium]